jgi:microsomal dipeptidase-like Zn-dependent dipeptidase
LSSIGSSTSLGPVQAYLSGVARADAKGEVPSSVSIPTVSEATDAVERIAQVRGADGVAGLGSDYRKIALASGLNVTWKVEVMAWGTAVMRAAEPDGTA